MVDALVGAVIMVTATTSLVLALQVAETALKDAGCYSLTNHEIEVLRGAGLTTPQSQQSFFNQTIQALPKDLEGGTCQ